MRVGGARRIETKAPGLGLDDRVLSESGPRTGIPGVHYELGMPGDHAVIDAVVIRYDKNCVVRAEHIARKRHRRATGKDGVLTRRRNDRDERIVIVRASAPTLD